MVNPLSYFSFQPVFHNLCGMCCPVCRGGTFNEPLRLIRVAHVGSGFPLCKSDPFYHMSI